MSGEAGWTRPTGRLFVVATPIGNLEDITLRALRVLGEVEAIACEDTRETIKLLARHGLKKRLISYFHPREGRRVPEIIGLLKSGRDVALVSDAGTPGISDPGFPLIREALKEGVPVVPIPGPSAVTAALSASGLPTHRFLFLGFPPPRKGGLLKFIARLLSPPAADARVSRGGRDRPRGQAGGRGQGTDQDPRGIHQGNGRGASTELGLTPPAGRGHYPGGRLQIGCPIIQKNAKNPAQYLTYNR
jgi:hypothetical protein